MNNQIDEMRRVNELGEYISLLEQATSYFQKIIGYPDFTPDAPARYKSPNPRVIQFLLCVRITSGLRAAQILISRGHIIEVGVLLRTIDDFIGDIRFVKDAMDTTPNAVQRKFIDGYFITDGTSQHVGRKQKVQASEGRFYGDLNNNPHHFTESVRAIDSMWDMYVHGDYEPVMELCEGNGFYTSGTQNLYRLRNYRKNIAIYVHRSFNIFFEFSYDLELLQLAEELAIHRSEFEKTDAYTDSPSNDE